MKLPKLIRQFIDRRHEDRPVDQERRKQSFGDADKRLKEAVKDFEQTVRINREDFYKRVVANDLQQEVVFSTFRIICKDHLEMGDHRLCRHPKHEAANTGIAKCEESLCPFMLGRVA